jgi:hypothetical protein
MEKVFNFSISLEVVHFNHISATTMQLMSKLIYFMTSCVLVLRVHVIVICYNRICNYRKG